MFVVLQARYCEDLGIAQDLIVWLYSCIGLTSLLARVPGSRFCDLISPQRVFGIFVTVSAVSSILLPLATNWIRLLCFAIVYGLADGLMAIGIILSCMQTLTQKQKAQGYGFFQLFICTALLCGPPIGGKLAVTLVTNEWIARCTLPRSIAHNCYIAQCANPCYDIACNVVGTIKRLYVCSNAHSNLRDEHRLQFIARKLRTVISGVDTRFIFIACNIAYSNARRGLRL